MKFCICTFRIHDILDPDMILMSPHSPHLLLGPALAPSSRRAPGAGSGLWNKDYIIHDVSQKALSDSLLVSPCQYSPLIGHSLTGQDRSVSPCLEERWDKPGSKQSPSSAQNCLRRAAKTPASAQQSQLQFSAAIQASDVLDLEFKIRIEIRTSPSARKL